MRVSLMTQCEEISPYRTAGSLNEDVHVRELVAVTFPAPTQAYHHNDQPQYDFPQIIALIF